MSVHGFWIFASSILKVLVILQESVFKLSVSLDIYFFLFVGILPVLSVDSSLLRTLNL